jgi:acetoacetyl-CoA synthetase
MIEVLSRIWAKVLGRSPIDVDESFFDLGGDPTSAMRLFAEIKGVCGRELPAEIICRAPTIRNLAASLDRANDPPSSSLVLLKPGIMEPPVFIIHGLDGGVLKFFPLARHLTSDHPIYGIQAKGFYGEQPLDRVEEMAPLYVDGIQKLQPHGPYILIGYSFGGLVMLEIAERLEANGENIALLVMVDTYPHLVQLTPIERVRVRFRRAKSHLSEIQRLPPREALAYITTRWQHRSRISGERRDSTFYGTAANPAQLVKEHTEFALLRYKPRICRGKIRFIRSETGSYFPEDPVAVWGRLATEFECETVPGDHQSMLTTHFDKLGIVLSRYLKEAALV